MPDNKFHLVYKTAVRGERRGEVRVNSRISPVRSGGEDDQTVTAAGFAGALRALGEVDEITVIINSPGGVVTEAVAMRSELIKHPAAKTVEIVGCCDSAATLIACLPGARVRMYAGAEYMIHRCSMGVWGNANALRSACESAQTTDNSMADIYAARTGKSREECLALMDAETWYGAQEALEAGFVDEVVTGAEGAVACAVDAQTMELMRACYAHAPERALRVEETQETDSQAPGGAAEDKGGEKQMDLKELTREALAQENPALAQEIAQRAVEAERARVAEIRELTPPGEKWEALAREHIAAGTSSQEYWKKVIAMQRQAGHDYIQARARETAPAARVGGGDSGDHDKDAAANEDKVAADIAKYAATMSLRVAEMAKMA